MNCIRLMQLLFAVKSASAMSLHILTKGSKILTRSGQNLTLPCLAKGKNFDAFTNPVIWYKVADNGEEFQINTGAVISTPYAETGRYAVDPRVDFGTISEVEMPLSIKGLTLAENGTYRCQLRSRSKVLSSIVHLVDITGPITKLELKSSDHRIHNKTKQSVFVFDEKEPSTVSCEFEGSGPPPVMHIIRGTVDISPLFVRTESIQIIGEPGLQYTMYHIEYKSTKLKMESVNNEETLYCTAQVPTFTELSLTKTAVIKVLYAAKFSCNTELLATVGEVDLEISCRITANPPAEVNNVWWTFSRRDWNLTNGQIREGFSSHNALKDGTVIATLTIANVSNSSFQTYYLTVHTELATRQHAIILEEDIPTTLAPTTTTKPPTTELTTDKIKKSTSALPTTTTTVPRKSTGTTTSATTRNIQSTPSTLKPSKSKAKVSPFSTIATSTHKRRKYPKHKHKKKKQRERQTSSTNTRTITVPTIVLSTKLPTSKVQETSQVSNHKNKTSENKTVEKQDTPVDVHYTIIDEPVKENNAKTHSSGFSLHITSCYGFILYVLCMLISL